MTIFNALKRFDPVLHSQGKSLRIVLIGGAALQGMGAIIRETRDCDVLDPDLPKDVLESALVFAQSETAAGRTLRNDWLNNGPSSLRGDLIHGWEKRIVLLFRGIALEVYTLGREDLLATKLYALCDRGEDLPDVLALHPTLDEIKKSTPWIQDRDMNPMWPAHVEITLNSLMELINHGV